LNEEENNVLKEKFENLYNDILDLYNESLDSGVAKELARLILPVSNYTEFYFTADLRNLFHFLELRLHEHAQLEIRVFAEAIMQMLKEIPELKWSVEVFEEMSEVNYLILSCIDKDKDLTKLKDHLRKFLE